MGLRAQIHRIHPAPQVVVVLPATGDLRSQRTGRPRVHDIGIGHETARLAALVLGVSDGRLVGRIDRQQRLVRSEYLGVVRVAVGIHGVPHRDRHPEEPLPGDQPVAVEALDPRLVPHLHVGRMPVEFSATGDQRRPQVLVAAAVADVPLPRGDDLQRLVALFEELHRVCDLLDVTDEVAGFAQHLGHPLFGGEHGRPGESLVRGPPGFRRDPVRHTWDDPAVPAHDRARVQLQLSPPRDIRGVTERTDHRDARALVGFGQRVGDHGDLDPEHRRGDGLTEQWLVALVVGMGDQGHASSQQFRAGGLDEHPVIPVVESDPVVRAGPFPVLEFGLGNGRAEGDIPQSGRFGLVRLSARQVAQERALGHGAGALVDGLIRVVPVDRQAQPPPEVLERLLVLLGEALAQLHEIAPGDGRLVLAAGLDLKIRVIVQRRFAAHAEVVLDAAFGRQAVVVPAHRVEDLEPAHALVARDAVGVGVAEDVTDVQRSADRGWGSVDAVDLFTGLRAIEAVHLPLVPLCGPLAVQSVHRGSIGNPRVVHD